MEWLVKAIKIRNILEKKGREYSEYFLRTHFTRELCHYVLNISNLGII